MNRSEFSSLIRNPGSVGRPSLNDLREVLQIFPWFQSAHMLMLKGLRNTDDVKFDIQLRESAPHISDRARLYYLLNNTDQSANADPALTKPVDPYPAGDNEPDFISDEQGQKVAGEMSTVTIPESTVPENGLIIVTRPEDVLRAEIDKRLEEINLVSAGYDNVNNEDTLLELEGSTDQADFGAGDLIIERSSSTSDLLELETANQGQGSQKDLIDRFIEMNPRLEVSRDREGISSADLSEPHTAPRIPFASETLARIYIEQGYYSRAIDIYDKLCLKYPEKSSYFAAQIEMINDLIKNG